MQGLIRPLTADRARRTGRLPGMDPTFMDPELSWWAKIRHAERHRERLTELYNRYRAAGPFRVEAVPTIRSGNVAYRLHLTEPIPSEIPLIVGDVLHNLRSALDSLVYEMTTRAVGRRLEPEEERACQFPIAPDPATFEAFFTRHAIRNWITPQYLRDVIRFVQPFRWLEEAKHLDVESAHDLDYETDSRYNALTELRDMSNLDKHRRLALTAWRPNMVWWGSDGESNRRWIPGDGTFEDGSIIGYIVGTDEGGSDVVYDFNLTLPDLPAYADPRVDRDDVVKLASSWVRETDVTVHRLIYYWTMRDQSNQVDGGSRAVSDR
jgi:hypothetical protein